MARVSLVVAVSEGGVIGADGGMPWRLSTDLQRFKKLTLGKPMIMGRKTFESIGKALPGRTSIVVTRDAQWQADGVVPVRSLDAAFDLADELAQAQGMDEICVVGGGQIYAQSMERADVLHVTVVHATPQGDTVFPSISDDLWEMTHEESVGAGEKDSAETTYRIYHRRPA